MRKVIVLPLLVLVAVGCKQNKAIPISANTIVEKNIQKSEKPTETNLKSWHLKDILEDTIPGISLKKAYEKIGDQELEEVIVAVIDTEIDIQHEDLKENIWTNPNEIPNNDKDDDQNGYIDDIHGWNFIGNKKRQSILYSNMSSIRVLRYYDEKFAETKGQRKLSAKGKENYQKYMRAKRAYDSVRKWAVKNQKYGDFLVETYPKSKELLKQFFPKENYTIQQLDSLFAVYKTDKKLAPLIYYMADYMKYDLSQEYITDYQHRANELLAKTYNLNYYDREILGDDPHNLTDTNYGNKLVGGVAGPYYDHSTEVSGLIAAERNNEIGINGIAENVKLMPIPISSNGDEYAKDIALAIRYAVDNGAKVINMSFSNDFSLHEDWVLNAIKYAGKNDVLVISSAGNTSKNLNSAKNLYYPNDKTENGKQEVSGNFILVGSTSYMLDKDFLSPFSNYGNKEVDLFAPGQEIYTTFPDNEYRSNSGTSLSSAITSGVAALIWSYKPNLTAKQVKTILMESGVEYNLEVQIGYNSPVCKPFGTLSKSGKVLNAYNALLMADKVE